MSVVDPRTPLSDYDRLALELKAIRDRIDSLEAPTGTSLYRTVSKLQALVEDIQAQLDAWTTTRYTNAQVDAKDAAVAGQIQPAINATLAGNVTVGGQFRSPVAYATDLTGTRRTAWLQNDGLLGYASSSAERKTGIEPADIDVRGILDLTPREFYYRREILRRVNLRATYGIDYMPARELGLIAEEVDEVAPWLVYHDDEGRAEGIEYSMLAVALLAVVREQDARIRALEGGA